MPIRSNNKKIASIFQNGKKIAKAYQNNKLIFSSAPEIEYYPSGTVIPVYINNDVTDIMLRNYVVPTDIDPQRISNELRIKFNIIGYFIESENGNKAWEDLGIAYETIEIAGEKYVKGSIYLTLSKIDNFKYNWGQLLKGKEASYSLFTFETESENTFDSFINMGRESWSTKDMVSISTEIDFNKVGIDSIEIA